MHLKQRLVTVRLHTHIALEPDLSRNHVAPASPPAAQVAQADLLREAEAHRALADLFPHLKLDALRAIQDLFPLNAQCAAGSATLH
jgi:hypothetical protein